jgi:hypothetical protein
MTGIHYDFIRDSNHKVIKPLRGTLLSDLVFETPIKGHDVDLGGIRLTEVGTLTLHAGFNWDFGSGAIDTPEMVKASAAHDAFCLMTDLGHLPWSVRAQSDKYFRELLEQNGVGFCRRWWCWMGVRSYSKTFAYWNRKA